MTHGGARKGAGRPTRSPATAHLHIRIPPTALEAYRKLAAANGLTLAMYVRSVLALDAARGSR